MACNKKQTCRTMDPNTGFVYVISVCHLIAFFFNLIRIFSHRYDMSELKGKQYQIRSTNHTYVFGICESPKSPCLEDAGSCRTTNGQSTSLGISNDDLQLKDKAIGTPFLQYKAGSACVTSNSTAGTRFTTIEFVCLTDGMAADPKIIEEYDCEIVIHFPTKAACQSPVNTLLLAMTDVGSRFYLYLKPVILSVNNILF